MADAVALVLEDQDLRRRLGEGSVAAAGRWTWDRVVDVQEEIYDRAAARTAVRNASTLGS